MMRRKMKAVSTNKTAWVKYGYTKKQSKQVNACYGTINKAVRRKCTCETCSKEIELETSGGVLYFLAQHRGHDTIITKAGKT